MGKHSQTNITLPDDKARFSTTLSQPSQLFEYYLSGDISEPSDYTEWFHEIRSAKPGDQVRIYINSHGGLIDTAIQFMRVLGETEADVTCSIEGSCASAATMIFLCADNFEITPHSLFMIHNYSGGMFGKGADIYDQAVFERKWSSEFMHAIYEDFLTTEEIEQVLNNKDFWLTSEEVLDRCTKMTNTRLAKIEDMAGEAGDDYTE